MIPKEPSQPRPRAFEYYNSFAALNPDSPTGWRRIDSLEDARRGDILAWRFPVIEPGEDTGHVLFVADPPRTLNSGIFAVRVYDSADTPHFDDTRGTGEGQFPNGVGSGFINFKVDSDARPIAFQFGPGPHDNSFVSLPIAIGRVEPLT
jgi:hypothetical protein